MKLQILINHKNGAAFDKLIKWANGYFKENDHVILESSERQKKLRELNTKFIDTIERIDNAGDCIWFDIYALAIDLKIPNMVRIATNEIVKTVTSNKDRLRIWRLDVNQCCPICLDENYEPFRNVPCGHAFCFHCLITAAVKRTTRSVHCPVCREISIVFIQSSTIHTIVFKRSSA